MHQQKHECRDEFVSSTQGGGATGQGQKICLAEMDC